MKGQASNLYSGDTTTRESLWVLGNSAEALAAVFVKPLFLADWSLWHIRPVV